MFFWDTFFLSYYKRVDAPLAMCSINCQLLQFVSLIKHSEYQKLKNDLFLWYHYEKFIVFENVWINDFRLRFLFIVWNYIIKIVAEFDLHRNVFFEYVLYWKEPSKECSVVSFCSKEFVKTYTV